MSMQTAKLAVDCEEGQTAHWYGRNIYGCYVRMGYLYNDFRLAIKHGLIRCERNSKNQTVYFKI